MSERNDVVPQFNAIDADIFDAEISGRISLEHFVTELIRAEVRLGRNPPHTEEGIQRLVEHAARYCDAIAEEVNG
jgi:hypothetical protein